MRMNPILNLNKTNTIKTKYTIIQTCQDTKTFINEDCH